MPTNYWMNNEIYLRRQMKITVPTSEHPKQDHLPSSYILQLNGNLSKLGYVLAQLA